MNAKLTIITSVYKGKDFIEGFLEDITSQGAFGLAELYMLDANSPDGEYKVIQEFMKKHKNIRYERLPEDPGLYGCWNHMIKNSNSPYITNANLDDRLIGGCLDRCIRELDSNLDVDLVYGFNLVATEPNTTEQKIKEENQNSIVRALQRGKVQMFPCLDFSLTNLLSNNSPHNHPMWRRSLHDRYGYFSTDYVSASDWEFWLRCAFGGASMKMINDILGIYYYNPSGISTDSKNMNRNVSEVQEIASIYKKKLQERN
jgi:glycosyltransferase involved in cell wall biosynthesis